MCGECKVVDVHHYDEDHGNKSKENLIPLCPTHHGYVHSRYKQEVIPVIEEFRRNLGRETARGGRLPCTENIAGSESLALHQ